MTNDEKIDALQSRIAASRDVCFDEDERQRWDWLEEFRALLVERPKIDPCPDIKGYVSGGGLDRVMSKVRAPASEPVAWRDVHDHTNLYYKRPYQVDTEPLYAWSGDPSVQDYASTQPERAGVVPGWKLVPVEPTEDMRRATNKCGDLYEAWAAMLNAAPPAPAPECIASALHEKGVKCPHCGSLAAPPAPEAVVKESLTTPEKREPLTVITLPDGAELRNTDHYGWRLYREGRDIRLLDYWEQTFINAAIHAAHGVPPAIEKHSRLTDQKINDAIRDGGIVSCDDATWAFRAGVEFAEDFHGITPADAKEGGNV